MINSFASKVISLSLVASALGGGSYYFYSINSPTNVEELLKWNGYSLASQDNTWKAILAENKENWTFIGEIDKNNLTTSASKLKEKCQELFKKLITNKDKSDESYEKAKKHCIDNIQTIKGNLIKSGKHEFDSSLNDDQYRVIYTLNKEYSSFISLIKEEKSEQINNENGHIVLKKWCESQLETKVNSSNNNLLTKVSNYCSPYSYKTIEEKIKDINNSWEIEKDNWDKLFDKWKHTDVVLESINKSSKEEPNQELTQNSEGSQGKDKMKSWCENGLKKNLWEEKVWGKGKNFELIQIMSACVKNQPLEETNNLIQE